MISLNPLVKLPPLGLRKYSEESPREALLNNPLYWQIPTSIRSKEEIVSLPIAWLDATILWDKVLWKDNLLT